MLWCGGSVTFELFSYIMFGITIVIVPIYMWLLYNIKNSWTSNSHDTQGGSMTIVKDDLKVTFKDPIVKKKWPDTSSSKDITNYSEKNAEKNLFFGRYFQRIR